MKYLTIFFILLFLVGCTGRVQTNPVPKDEEIALPKYYDMNLKSTLSPSIIKDYEAFIEIIFAKPKDESRNIWSEGYKREYK
jgi:hypothetical protein